MSLEAVKVNKLNGGLGRSNPTDDSVMMLAYVVPDADLPENIAHYTGYELLQPSDAATLGFDAANDANKKVLVYHFVSEFFRLAPDATLFLVPVADQLSPLEIITLTAFQQAIKDAGNVKGIAIAGTTEDATALAAMVDDIQTQIDALATQHRLIDFLLLQGNGKADGTTAIADYTDMRTKSAPAVTISLAQDPYVISLDAAYVKYADVGAVLGMAAVRMVDENWGSVNIVKKPDAKKGTDDYPLTSGSLWPSANLSDGTKESSLSAADTQSLTAKGYVFAGHYEGYGGIFLNSSPTCVEAASDYAYVENNRVWNKAARLVRSKLIPLIKGVIPRDPATGYIRSTTITSWENIAKKALDGMETAGEISGSEIYINPAQNVTESNPLSVKATVTVNGILYDISLDLGLK